MAAQEGQHAPVLLVALDERNEQWNRDRITATQDPEWLLDLVPHRP